MPKLGQAPDQEIAIPVSHRVVAIAMADGAGFNVGAETWTVGRGRGRRRKPSPNRAAIRALKRRLPRWFKKHGRAHPDLAAIGARITACGQRRLRHRCLHPACPRCAHAFQRLLVRVVRRHRGRQPDEAWVTVSIVLPPRDPAGAIAFAAERDRYRALLDAAGITRGVFALDLSFNEDHRPLPASQRFADHAAVHLYGLAPAAEMTGAEATLKRLVPTSDAVRRPVRIKAWDGSPTSIAYCMKPSFARRQTILKPDERREKLVRDTRDRPLTVAQQIRAVRALDRAGLTGRLILLGLRFEADDVGRLCLAPTT